MKREVPKGSAESELTGPGAQSPGGQATVGERNGSSSMSKSCQISVSRWSGLQMLMESVTFPIFYYHPGKKLRPLGCSMCTFNSTHIA